MSVAVKHAEQVLAELVQRDDYSYSDRADAQYRLQQAHISPVRYADLCLSHGIDCPVEATPDPINLTSVPDDEDV